MIATRGPLLGLLWLGLAASYLAASAFGQRTVALAILGVMTGALFFASGRWFTGLVTATVLAVLAWQFADAVRFLVFIPPLAAFAFMAFFFGRTLRAGSEPLINRIARKEHPELPEDIARHARWLTGVWTACFVAMFTIALVLAALVPLETWSRCVHAMGYLVPAALFLGEYVYRLRCFPHHSQGSLGVLIPNVLAVMREMALERR
jgi:uncharacterized membrane protein